MPTSGSSTTCMAGVAQGIKVLQKELATRAVEVRTQDAAAAAAAGAAAASAVVMNVAANCRPTAPSERTRLRLRTS